ncbi:MAG: hypothetical protein KDI71_11050 [Xanthomonadales bacterium]|nr:hypothetical protein [Xanthomonadales bacterium]
MTAFLIEASKDASLQDRDSASWRRALAHLTYRGPDGQNCISRDAVRIAAANRFLGTRNRSPQPMDLTASALTVVFDGRLNAPAMLARRLARPSNLSDVELVGRAYQNFGDRFSGELEGDYALVIYDGHRRELMAAVDLFGTRAIYWAESSTAIVVSNELPAVVEWLDRDVALDPQSVADFLMHGYVDFFDKKRTPFAGIHALEPGHQLVLREGRVSCRRVRRFSDLLVHTPPPAPADIPHAFAEVMREAMRDRLEAPRVLLPVSGGLDSTTLTAAAASLARRGEVPAKLTAMTSVLSADDPEWALAQPFAAELGIPHQRVVNELMASTPNSPPQWHPPNTLMSRPPDASYEKLEADHELVIYGSAGDSTIAPESTNLIRLLRHFGLRHAVHARRVSRLQGSKLSIGTGLRGGWGRLPADEAIMHAPHPFPDWLSADFVATHHLRERWQTNLAWKPDEDLHPHHPLAQFWLQWPKWFQARAAVGLDYTPPEWTDPYLDSRVISFCFSLPPSPWMSRKYLLREAGKGLLPEAIRSRPKAPVRMPQVADRGFAQSLEMLDAIWPQELNEFVAKESLPPIQFPFDAVDNVPHARPRSLARWVSELPRWKLRRN